MKKKKKIEKDSMKPTLQHIIGLNKENDNIFTFVMANRGCHTTTKYPSKILNY